MQAAKKYQAENERRERERAALAKPVPLALQYLYDGSQRVQKEEDVINNEVIEGREEVAGELEAGQESIPPVFPYGVYDSIENDTIEDKNPDTFSPVYSLLLNFPNFGLHFILFFRAVCKEQPFRVIC